MVMGVKQLQRLFRQVSGLEIDKSDVKRLNDFIGNRLRTLLLQGQVAASINGRDIIDYQDIPITIGLQQAIREFIDRDEKLSLAKILRQQATLPPLRMDITDLLEKKLPELVGGITVGLAKVFRVVNKEIKNPGSREWDQVEEIYRILL
ncbi:MAG: hypothetical protein DSY90_05125 [Deltaproteobacteria bacterium]|nr:MAG: hypothetical protein DSY90_05125 [Deltaproteobacteria bacterium]